MKISGTKLFKSFLVFGVLAGAGLFVAARIFDYSRQYLRTGCIRLDAGDPLCGFSGGAVLMILAGSVAVLTSLLVRRPG